MRDFVFYSWKGQGVIIYQAKPSPTFLLGHMSLSVYFRIVKNIYVLLKVPEHYICGVNKFSYALNGERMCNNICSFRDVSRVK